MIHLVFVGAAKAAAATVHAIHGAITAHLGTTAHRELARQGGKLAAKSLTSGGPHALGTMAATPHPVHLFQHGISGTEAGTSLVAGLEGFAWQIDEDD
jgi:hypothetical protein